MQMPRVSIALLTRNGAETLPAVFEAIRRQHCREQVEVVAVDSGSTDGSAALLQRLADQVVAVPEAEFNHGATRNLAMERCRGDFVVFLVQDAVPASDHWLAALIEPFGDTRVAGVYGRQVPRPDASRIARHALAGWVTSSPSQRVVELAHAGALDEMDPIERLRTCAFDNVCSCVRRSVWAVHPFRPTPIAEDLAWGREVLVAGHRLVYEPRALVTHSHDRSLAYEWRRTRDLHDRLLDLFGLQTIPTVGSLARAILSSAALHVRLEWRQPSRLPRALGLAVVWPLGQYAGARAARNRRRASSPGVAACAS